MATATFTSAPTNTTDAQFRDWGSKFSAALAAVGMVQTADTGQINWSTVLAPTAVSLKMGYEIWRFNDSLQATHPLFLRFDYGSNSSAKEHPAIYFAIGKGSTGAGVLTGAYTNMASAVSQTFTTSTTTTTSYVSSVDGSSLCWSLWPAVVFGQNSCMFTLERQRNSSGAPAGNSWGIVQLNGAVSSATRLHYSVAYSATSGSNSNYTAATLPCLQSSDVSLAGGSGVAPLASTLFWDGVSTVWQGRAALLGMRADLPSLVPITVSGFGTYLPLGQAGQINISNSYFCSCLAWS